MLANLRCKMHPLDLHGFLDKICRQKEIAKLRIPDFGGLTRFVILIVYYSMVRFNVFAHFELINSLRLAARYEQK